MKLPAMHRLFERYGGYHEKALTEMVRLWCIEQTLESMPGKSNQEWVVVEMGHVSGRQSTITHPKSSPALSSVRRDGRRSPKALM